MIEMNKWQGPKLQWVLGILLVAGIVWLLLLFPYSPGPSLRAIPLSSAHYALMLLVAMTSFFSFFISLALAAFSLIRRRKDLAPHVTTFFLFFILSWLSLSNASSWGHEMARHRAMRNAEPILAAIETHKSRRGAYPDNIESLNMPLATGVRGIERYAYERIEDEFKLSFTIDPGSFNPTVVMYRPSGNYVGKGEMPTIHHDAKWGYYVFD